MNASNSGTVSLLSRRAFLLSAGAAPLMAAAVPYRLGCMTGLYANLPLADALERIRKIGYRYASPGRTHAGETVFDADMPASKRIQVQQQFRDHGIEPFMTYCDGGHLADDVHRAGKLDHYRAVVDLAAGFGIRVIIAAGPWYYQKFPNIPRTMRDWEKELAEYYPAMEKLVRYAESAGVTIAMKPHTGITANAKACIGLLKRIPSERLQVCWDSGNVSFYEGIHPDPDLPELAPQVKGLCIKDHLGLRGEVNFPPPGQGQIDHEQLFRTLFSAGFNGPMTVERINGRTHGLLAPEAVDEALTAAYRYVTPILDRLTARGT
jgi:sugar phosphate isomerase/epimerase